MSHHTLLDTDSAQREPKAACVAHAIATRVEGDRILADAADIAAATGWQLEAQGFCRGDVCVPVRDSGAAVDGRVDVEAFAALLDRPLALDREHSALVLGTSPGERADLLAGLAAPDFALPDLTGQLHRLSDHRGKKVLLIAYASW